MLLTLCSPKASTVSSYSDFFMNNYGVRTVLLLGGYRGRYSRWSGRVELKHTYKILVSNIRLRGFERNGSVTPGACAYHQAHRTNLLVRSGQTQRTE